MFPKDTEQYQFNYICKALCVVVHEKRIAALFHSTISAIFQHRFFHKTGEQLFCVPEFFRVRIIFLKCRGSQVIFRCRSPPSDFDSAIQLKNRNRRITHEENQSAGLLPVLYKGHSC